MDISSEVQAQIGQLVVSNIQLGKTNALLQEEVKALKAELAKFQGASGTDNTPTTESTEGQSQE